MNSSPEQNPALQRHLSLSRRHFLRGLGACLALPAFESLRPFRLEAATAAAEKLGTTASGAPLRTAFVYFPNGAIPGRWWPDGEGKDFQLNHTMQPLERLKDQVQVISGLDHANATPGPDG